MNRANVICFGQDVVGHATLVQTDMFVDDQTELYCRALQVDVLSICLNDYIFAFLLAGHRSVGSFSLDGGRYHIVIVYIMMS